MPKAVMTNVYQHSGDGDTAILSVTFRFLGAGFDYGTIDTDVTVISTDTAATITTAIQDAVIARAAEYGVTLTSGDIIPVVRGVPDTLMSSANSSTLRIDDNGVDQYLIGSLGALALQSSYASPILFLGDGSASMNFSSGGYFKWTDDNIFGTSDLLLQGVPSSASGYMIFEGYNSAGVALSTGGNSNPISMWVNRTKVAEFDAGGLTMVGGVEMNSVAKQTYSVTNLTTDRAYNANSTTVAELADVLGTLIDDLRTIGMVA